MTGFKRRSRWFVFKHDSSVAFVDRESIRKVFASHVSFYNMPGYKQSTETTSRGRFWVKIVVVARVSAPTFVEATQTPLAQLVRDLGHNQRLIIRCTH